ncbi:MAG: hypothetical protein FWD42_00060 [Solirubrobacterales bacterium]|nr:hypothetical protein [Solirubrobacterales bacterium]
MSEITTTRSLERAALLRWAASLGAITSEALAHRWQLSPASARARLQAAVRLGLLARTKPLTGEPALYSATRAGLRECGMQGLGVCRPTAANARHLVVCAEVGAALERCYPDHRLAGERELRHEEAVRGLRLASAVIGSAGQRHERLHRPDLVMWAPREAGGLPVAIEVELTLKGPRRLERICRAWARCREVSGVLYLCPQQVCAAVERAIERAGAGERVVALTLERLPGVAIERAVAGRP